MKGTIEAYINETCNKCFESEKLMYLLEMLKNDELRYHLGAIRWAFTQEYLCAKLFWINSYKKHKKSNKTVKNKKLKNQTEDEPYKYSSCVAGLKPFEEEFLKKKHTFSRKKDMAIFRKKLSNLASPKSITPQDDFYTYINYNWYIMVTEFQSMLVA